MRKLVASVAVAAAVALGGLLGTVPAKANTYNFTFIGNDGYDVLNGSITTDGSNIATSVSGNVIDPGYSGVITALVAVGTPGYGAYAWDNVVTPGAPYFSATQSSGILFLFGSGIIGNLYYQPNNITYYLSLSEPASLYNPGDAGVFSLTETPLPSTWTMLIAGFVGFGFLAYRGTKKSTALAAA